MIVSDNLLSNNLVSNFYNNCKNCKSIMSKISYKEWQIMLGLHLVSVTLLGQSTISTQRDK